LYEDKIQRIPEVYTNIASLDFGKQVTYVSPNGQEHMDVVILASGEDPTHVVDPLIAIQKHADKIGNIHVVNLGGDFKRIEPIIQHVMKKPKLYGKMPIHEILAFFVKPENIESHHVVFMTTESTNQSLIYDVLLAGFPLIYSIDFMINQGYYVRTGSDTLTEQYGRQFQRILTEHNVTKTVADCKKHIEQFDPYNLVLIEQYTKLMR